MPESKDLRGRPLRGGAIETVVHVLVDCPKLREARQQLRTKVGYAFNSIATMLGGRPRNGQGKVGNGVINRESGGVVVIQ